MNKSIKRINLFAGPCAGKSTAAASLFSRLKAEHFGVELVQEYVKEWAYQKRPIKPFDQVQLFSEQLRREYSYLQHNAHIITDCPLMMVIVYAIKHNAPCCDALVSIAKCFEDEYPSLNIFVERPDKYEEIGRYQTYEQALKIDQEIHNLLDANDVKYVMIKYNDIENMMKLVKEKS